MFSDIKFNCDSIVLDHNNNELQIGNTVLYNDKYGCYRNSMLFAIIIGITLNEKFIWLSDGYDIFKRKPSNVILVNNPEKYKK
jgi:hypothetical protein